MAQLHPISKVLNDLDHKHQMDDFKITGNKKFLDGLSKKEILKLIRSNAFSYGQLKSVILNGLFVNYRND